MPISADDQVALIVVLEIGDLLAHDRTQAALGSGLVFRIKMRVWRKRYAGIYAVAKIDDIQRALSRL